MNSNPNSAQISNKAPILPKLANTITQDIFLYTYSYNNYDIFHSRLEIRDKNHFYELGQMLGQREETGQTEAP